MILIELLSSSIIFFILFFKDQLLSSASLRSLQATGISIQPLAETQEDFFFFHNFLGIARELLLTRNRKRAFPYGKSPLNKSRVR